MSRHTSALLACLRGISRVKFGAGRFCIGRVARSLRELRDLGLKRNGRSVGRIVTHLRCELAGSCLECMNNREFKFIGPSFILGHLSDVTPGPCSSVGQPIECHNLFSIGVRRTDSTFFRLTLRRLEDEISISNRRARGDELTTFLGSIRPGSPFCCTLRRGLGSRNLSEGREVGVLIGVREYQ